MLFSTIFLFVIINVNVFAMDLSYDGAKCVSCKDTSHCGVTNWGNMMDDNLSTSCIFKSSIYGSRAQFSFDKCFVVGYFVKASDYSVFDLYFYDSDQERINVDKIKKHKINANGGFYYMFDEPMQARNFLLESKQIVTVFEFEVLSKDLLEDFEEIKTNVSYEKITVNYRVNNAMKYDVYLNDKKIETTTKTNYTFDNLQASTEYTIKIVAKKFGYFDKVVTKKVTTSARSTLKLDKCTRKDNVVPNDTITYIFNENISTLKKNNITDFKSYVINGNLVKIQLENPYNKQVVVNFTVTGVGGGTLTINNNFKTIKKGGIFMDFKFITDFFTELVGALKTNSVLVITAVLGLAAIIWGSFFLIGLGKKALAKGK